MAEAPEAKRPRTGTMPPEMKEEIEKSLALLGEVEAYKKPHRKGGGPIQPRVLPPEYLEHDKAEEIRKGHANRVHFVCSNPKCEQPIRQDKWDTHVLQATSDLHLQESPEEVLARSRNFAPGGQWFTKESRLDRMVTFMERRPQTHRVARGASPRQPLIGQSALEMLH